MHLNGETSERIKHLFKLFSLFYTKIKMSSENPVKINLLCNRKTERKVKIMDLTDQTVSNTNEICIQDSLNASLMKLKVKMGATSVAPSNNDLIVYVDKQPSSSPTTERKQYVFNLTGPLKYCNETSDELIQQFKTVDNKIQIEAFVKRKIGTNESSNYVLETSIAEELDANIITLFEGVNYIYTNYSNGEITIIYPKDNEVTRAFLNNATFYEHLMNDEDDFNLDDIYFKDAFTKLGDKLNLEVDNACVECITSKNNKFSLDSEGNLIVNSITTNEGPEQAPTIDNATICNLIYPVGSIYMSVNSASPATLFGGTWSRINGYYLYAGTGGNIAGSNTSGGPSTNVTGSTAITVAQMPNHNHESGSSEYLYVAGVGSGIAVSGVSMVSNGWWHQDYKGAKKIMSQGGGQGHTHTLSSHTHSVTPLRYEVYMWKRIA